MSYFHRYHAPHWKADSTFELEPQEFPYPWSWLRMPRAHVTTTCRRCGQAMLQIVSHFELDIDMYGRLAFREMGDREYLIIERNERTHDPATVNAWLRETTRGQKQGLSDLCHERNINRTLELKTGLARRQLRKCLLRSIRDGIRVEYRLARWFGLTDDPPGHHVIIDRKTKLTKDCFKKI